jgi:siroheme synthase-like protein
MSNANRLFPVFLKLENLRLTIVGGGVVATEKLNAIVANSPTTKTKVIATWFCDEVKAIANKHANVTLIEKPYDVADLSDTDVLVVAVNDSALSTAVRNDAVAKRILVNVADKPELCDFYLGSIVQKGNIKIAISTNGKSPTLAKRLREFFTDVLPDELDDLAENLNALRNTLKTDFNEKVNTMNRLTKKLLE